MTERASITPAETTAAGVWLLATVALLMFWYWAAILAMSAFWKPEGGTLGIVTFGDYMTGERVFLAIIASIILTAASWSVGHKMIGR